MVQVGAVEGGIAAAAWSPDGGLLIILSAFGQLLMLNQVMHGSNVTCSFSPHGLCP